MQLGIHVLMLVVSNVVGMELALLRVERHLQAST